MQDLQMSSVVFYGSKLLKAAVRYGNMKLVTIHTVQVRGRRTPLQLNMVWYRPRVSGSKRHTPL